jgi:hypothetical protein
MVFVVLAMMRKLLLTGGLPAAMSHLALAARAVASAPPVADD